MEIYIISHDYDIANRRKINMDVCLILLPSMKQSQDMYGEKKKTGPRVVPKIHPSLICHYSLRSHAETGSAAALSDKRSANQCEDLKKDLD